MQTKNMIYGLLLWMIGLSGCDSFEKDVFSAYEEEPVGIYLEKQERFSEWVKLLKRADLYNALNINIKYTCFIVDNDALAAYMNRSFGGKSVESLTEEEAWGIAAYHVVPGSDYSYPTLLGKIGTKTVSGDYLTATIDTVDISKRYVNSMAIVDPRQFETPLINGILHQLEGVMEPLVYTLMGTLRQNPDYTIFVQGLEAAGLDAYLDRRDIEQQIGDEIFKLRDYKTLFGVPDSVFHKENIFNLSDLRLRFAGDPLDKDSKFYAFMAYHILGREYDFGDLTSYETGSGLNIPTYAAKEFLTISDKNGESLLNPTDPVRLVVYNIPANNGYLHVVDKIMEIVDPVRYPLEWEPTEWDEFRTIEFYRKPKIKNVDNEEAYEFKEPTEHMRWKSIPTEGVKVEYYNNDVDWDRFKFDDGIRVTFTNSGYIEFDTPVMMRGTYKVEMQKWAWNEAGTYQLYIDGVKCGSSFSCAGGTAKVQNFGNFYFDTSGQHVVRFKVVKPGRLIFDRFIFTPVN